MPGGRPRALTSALKTELCDRIAAGETVMDICRDDHMPACASVYRSLAAEPELREQYAQAREIQLQRMEDELLSIADETDIELVQKARLMIDTRKWVMSKRAPKKYGDRVVQQMEDTDGQAVAFPVVRVYSPKPPESDDGRS